MANDLYYIPGSYYRICDLTGFKVRAGRTKKQWNNYIVREQSWEPRNAQDFVRGRRDDQTVPEPRPRSPNVFLGSQTTVLTTAPVGSGVLPLANQIGLQNGNVIAVMLDNGVNFFVAITIGDFNPDFSSDFGQYVNLALPLPYQASAGNAVINTDFVSVQPQNYPAGS